MSNNREEGRNGVRTSSSSRSTGNRSSATRQASGSRQQSSAASRTAQTNRSRNVQTQGHSSSNGRKKMTKKQQRKRKRIILLVEIIVVLVLLLGLAVWLKLSKINQTGKLDEDELSINDLDDETKELLSGYTNIALFGLDNRSNGSYGSGNSDSIMIASIDNNTHEVKLVSVYRDTYLNVYDDSFKKCNSAYAKKGVEGAIAMLNQNLDLDIKEYVAVDFNAMVEVIDLLGGVDIDVTTEEAGYMKVYIDELQQVTGVQSSYVTGGGVCTLDGIQATAYCRVRYTAGDDFKRAERQRTVLSAMAEKAKKADLSTLNKIIDAVFDDIDTSLTSSDIIGLAAFVSQYEIADTSGFPFSQTTTTLGKKGDVVVPTTLESNVKILHAYLFGVENYQPSSTVTALSKQIISDTGKTESDGNTYSADYSPEDDTEDTETSSEK